ncbi:MAG: ATP-dependent DNA helicase [Clostridia bacterium]|nr:ATP-dependent DNA helicase [Clostridia bacterium]
MRYDEKRDVVTLTVEELCTSVLSGGNIDTRRNTSRFRERSRDHSRIYNKLHLSFGMRYYDRVELQNTCKLDGVYISVTGCADGVLCKTDGYSLDEVRVGRTDKLVSFEEEQYHRLRATVYAYLLCSQKECERVELRQIFFDTEHGDFEVVSEMKEREELRASYISVLSKILWRAHVIRDRETVRIPSARNAVFPYKSLRESQSEMIKECYRDIKHGSRLFCQAPTGIGKTVSTLYPAVKCVGEGIADRIFYLTSKQSIRREAFSAMQRMNAAGVGLRSCVLSAREGMCHNAAARLRGGRLSSSCNPDLCPYAKGYYDRASYAVADLLSSGDAYDSKKIREIAEKYKVCPYELSLDLSELCDVIICDYNYVFSPTVYLKRYFDGERGEKYIFLVDEAHNLPDRARDMFSARLSSDQFEALVAMLEENDQLTSATLSLLSEFEHIGRLCDNDTHYSEDGERTGYSTSRQLPEKFSETLELFAKKCDTWLKANTDHAAYLYVEDLAYKLFEYKKISERYGKGYLTFITREGESVSLLLYCLDPADELSSALDRAVATVMFSATLTPTEYFADILGGGKRTASVSFRSPFPEENLCVAIVDKISTRYEDREKSYKKISSCIAGTVSAKAGNYIVFFPSYGYLSEVKRIFAAKYPNVKILEQTKNMSQAQRDEFIASFQDDGKTRIAFCVLGGSFSEGIDLPGDKLIGVICVGVGLPGLSSENNIIRDYYEEKSGCGYDYAYTYPGMNSILQAVGRVIRTETDRGIAVLIDDRFSEKKYISMFPREWKNAKYTGNAQSLAQIARDFWDKYR